jgi:hypothetical protein
LYKKTIKQISNESIGHPTDIAGHFTVGTPSIYWSMLEFPNLEFKPSTTTGDNPPVIVTSDSESSPLLNTTYRGQDFTWWTYPGWAGAIPQPFVSWLTSRDVPVIEESIILWVRSDLFPGNDTGEETENIEVEKFELFRY